MKLLITTATIIALASPAISEGRDYNYNDYPVGGPQATATATAIAGARAHQRQGQRQAQGQKQRTTIVGDQDRLQAPSVGGSVNCQEGWNVFGSAPGVGAGIGFCRKSGHTRQIEMDKHNLNVASQLAKAAGKKGNQVFLTHAANTIPEARETLERVGLIRGTTASTRNRTQRQHETTPVRIGAKD